MLPTKLHLVYAFNFFVTSRLRSSVVQSPINYQILRSSSDSLFQEMSSSLGDTQREYNTRYKFNPVDKIGSILDTDIQIKVYGTEVERFSRTVAQSITHPNYLNCVGVDPLGKSFLHLHKSGTQFSLFMQSRFKGSRSAPIQWVKWTGSNGSPFKKPYVTSLFRTIIRGMISFLKYLHKIHNASLLYSVVKDNKGNPVLDDKGNPSLQSLDHSNFVYDDIIKYCCVNFIRRTDDSVSDDWRLLAEFLEKKVFHGYSELPRDIEDMLTRLKNANYDQEILLLNHLSIIQTDKKLEFFVAIYESRNTFDSMDSGEYIKSVASMQMNNWLNILIDPNLPTVVIECIKNVKKHDAVKGKQQDAIPTHKETKMDLLRCVRNLATHLPESHQITAIRTEVFISYMFLDQLINLQDCLAQNEVLQKFSL